MPLTPVGCLEMKWAMHAMQYEVEDDPDWGVDDGVERAELAEDRKTREMEKMLDRIEELAGEMRTLEKQIMALPEIVPRYDSSPWEFPATLSEEQTEYVVVAILGKKTNPSDNTTYYLCLWSSNGGVSWEAEDDIEGVNLIERYEVARVKRWEEIVEKQRSGSTRKFTQRAWPAAPRATPAYSSYSSTPSNIPNSEYDRLMHLDISALRAYLQTVTDFTPLHYDLLLRLSEEDVSRGCSQQALKRLRPATAAECTTQDTCAVCFDEFDKGVPPTILPCGHLYHSDCILSWLGNEKTCPLCKAEV